VGGRIDKAEDGFKAWEMIQTHNYDLVVSDIQMPRMTGLELKKIVRATPRFAELPFLMITGEVSEDIRASVRKSRYDGFLLKPFHRVVLEASLRELLNIPR
jgi:two-component system chemotaxis response regulator CheY